MAKIRFIPITSTSSANTITISDVWQQRIIYKSEITLQEKVSFICHIKNKYKDNSEITMGYRNQNGIKSNDSISPITIDTTRICNRLLLQTGDGTVIIGGSNPMPSLTEHTSIEVAFSVVTITNDVINNDVSTIPFDTNTTVQIRVHAEVEESEDQITKLLVHFRWTRVGASSSDAINEREYYADFTTIASFNRFDAEFRFAPHTRGTTIDPFTFQRAGEARLNFTDLRETVIFTCATTTVLFGSTLAEAST